MVYRFWKFTSTWVIRFQELVKRDPSSSHTNHNGAVQESN
jgi:hypothetical protein